MISQRKGGALLSYATIGLQNIVGLVYTPYLLRMLGSSEYGLYSLVTSIIAYITLLDFGFGDSIIRYTVRYKVAGKEKELKSLLGMFFLIYCIISICAIVIGIVFSFNLNLFFQDSMSAYEISRAQIMMYLLTGNLGMTFLFTVHKAYIDAHEKFIFVRSINLLRIVLNTLIMIILLQYGYKAVAQVVLITILNALITLSYLFYSHLKLKISISFKNIQWQNLREILSYSVFIFLNTVIANVYWSSGQFVLGVYEGTKTIAIYAIAIQLVNMYRHFTTSISNVFFPKITALATSSSNDEEISNLFIRIGRLQFAVIIFILAGFILFGKQFIRLWAGNDFSSAYYVTLIFFVALIPSQIQHMGWIITKARNQLKFRTLVYIFISAQCFVLLFPLSKNFGMIGTALTIAASLLLMEGLILNIYYQKTQHINILLFWKQILRQLLFPTIAVSILIPVTQDFNFDNWKNLLLAIAIFTMVYIPIFFITSTNSYEKGLAKKLFFRKKTP